MLAGRSIRDAIHSRDEVACIIAEQVRLEIDDNIDNVRNDANKTLNKLKDEIARIDKWSAALGQASHTDIGHFLTRIPVAESRMMDIVNKSLSHATTPDISHKALARMMQKKTPARRGKDSSKDCVVVESYLEVADTLRGLGHTSCIVFASSNTTEFLSDSNKSLNLDIKNEFDALKIQYSRNLMETGYMLGLAI